MSSVQPRTHFPEQAAGRREEPAQEVQGRPRRDQTSNRSAEWKDFVHPQEHEVRSDPRRWKDHLACAGTSVGSHEDRQVGDPAGTIVIIPSDYPGGDPELRLSNWNCEGHSFGLAILSLTGLVRAAQGGVYFCMGQNGKLKEMNRAEWLWNLIPAE